MQVDKNFHTEDGVAVFTVRFGLTADELTDVIHARAEQLGIEARDLWNEIDIQDDPIKRIKLMIDICSKVLLSPNLVPKD